MVAQRVTPEERQWRKPARRQRTARFVSVRVALLVTTLLTASCDDRAGAETESVRIGQTWFHLERAADEATRLKGLGGRDFIAPDGGMLFVFPEPVRGSFVMRDCPIPIDVAFLDSAGRVLTIHQMQPEPPRGPDEGSPGEVNARYESRLKQYPTRFPAQFAIETAAGRLQAIGLREGDLIDLDLDRLKRLTR